MFQPCRPPTQNPASDTHLKVANLERAVDFCKDVTGMDMTLRYGDQAAFMSWGSTVEDCTDAPKVRPAIIRLVGCRNSPRCNAA